MIINGGKKQTMAPNFRGPSAARLAAAARGNASLSRSTT